MRGERSFAYSVYFLDVSEAAGCVTLLARESAGKASRKARSTMLDGVLPSAAVELWWRCLGGVKSRDVTQFEECVFPKLQLSSRAGSEALLAYKTLLRGPIDATAVAGQTHTAAL